MLEKYYQLLTNYLFHHFILNVNIMDEKRKQDHKEIKSQD